MAEMKKAVVRALKFESTSKNRVNLNNDNKYNKIIPKELKFFDNPVSSIDQGSKYVDIKFTKTLNSNHRSFNPMQNSGRYKTSKMLVYEDCSDEDEPFRSTPPNIQDRQMIATPKAPMKSRKEFEKKVLRPKKLVYNDKENDYREDLSQLENNLYYSTPKKSDENEEDIYAGYYEKLIIPRKILPVGEDDSYRGSYSASRELNLAGTSGRSVQTDRINNSRSQQRNRKKNLNRGGGLQESKKNNKPNVQKNDVNYNKENNASQLRITASRQDINSGGLDSDSHKSRSNTKNDRNNIFPGNREDFNNNSSRIAELTHFRI